ncbi:unnamed protein product [Arabis nemorensis]|uniref:Uncharacterized protein n=1 Tax=Arabis nemorensis TaxID=586526 RepID=A0A565BBQ2_9BRAS|nr:unnamed protein product [Arabis nemorensis]
MDNKSKTCFGCAKRIFTAKLESLRLVTLPCDFEVSDIKHGGSTTLHEREENTTMLKEMEEGGIELFHREPTTSTPSWVQPTRPNKTEVVARGKSECVARGFPILGVAKVRDGDTVCGAKYEAGDWDGGDGSGGIGGSRGSIRKRVPVRSITVGDEWGEFTTIVPVLRAMGQLERAEGRNSSTAITPAEEVGIRYSSGALHDVQEEEERCYKKRGRSARHSLSGGDAFVVDGDSSKNVSERE